MKNFLEELEAAQKPAYFRKAFEAGLSASDEVDCARAEIEEVFAELARQVKEASQGRIAVERCRNELTAGTGKTNTCCGFAKHEIGDRGYPVTLVYGKDHNRVICRSRTELEHGLCDVLADPDTGALMRRLLRSEPGTDEA